MEIFSMFIQFNFELTLFEKEGGIARSAMTGDLRETNSNSEFVSINPPSDCFAISHLLFQRRFLKSSGALRHLLFQRRLVYFDNHCSTLPAADAKRGETMIFTTAL